MRSTSSKTLLLLSRSALASSLGLLLVSLALSCTHAAAQAKGAAAPPSVVDRGDASLGFNFIRANAPPGSCDCFDTAGGYGSVGFHFTNWLSLQAEVTGQHQDHIGTLGQNLTLITYTAGPRLSVPGRRFVPFVQGLVGQARATDSYFPTSGGGSTSSANSLAYVFGGGLDFNITRHFGIRVANFEYLHTGFPNGTDNVQRHLSIGSGIIFRFGNKNNGGRLNSEPPLPPQPVAPPPALEAAIPTPAPSPASAPAPVLRLLCSADVATVDQGGSIELTAKTITYPEGTHVMYTWTADQGKIVGEGSQVLLDTVGVSPGRYVAHGVAETAASSAGCDVAFRIRPMAETVKGSAAIPTGPPISEARDREFHDNVPDALFDYNSAVIRPDTAVLIDRARMYLNRHPEITVLLGGFADDRGSNEYNLKLGMRRAIATRNAMIAAGVAPQRLQIVTYGKDVQVCTENTETCRQQNRRVMFSMHP